MTRFARRDVVAVLRSAYAEAKNDRVTTIAQALAYALFLAIPSGLLVVLGVFSLLASPSDVAALIERAQNVMPAEAATLLRDSLQRSVDAPRSGILMTVVGGLLAVWATTSAATTLMEGLTTAFDQNDQRGFVRKRVTALLIVMCLIAAVALVGGLLILGPFLETWAGNVIGHPSLASWVWWTAQWPILVAGLMLAFATLLYLGPDVEQRNWKLVTPGAAAAVLIWLCASAGFSLYASQFGSYDKTWGTLSAVVVMLIWLWLTSVALLFGAEINAETQRVMSNESPLAGDELNASARG